MATISTPSPPQDVRSPVLGLLRFLSFLAPTPSRLYRRVYNALKFFDIRIYTACDITAALPRSTYLPHPTGIVIGRQSEIGQGVEIRQNVTMGIRGGDHPTGQPTIEDGVTIYAGAVILGEVTVGEGSVVGANAVVLDDVEAHSTVVGAPARPVAESQTEDAAPDAHRDGCPPSVSSRSPQIEAL